MTLSQRTLIEFKKEFPSGVSARKRQIKPEKITVLIGNVDLNKMESVQVKSIHFRYRCEHHDTTCSKDLLFKELAGDVYNNDIALLELAHQPQWASSCYGYMPLQSMLNLGLSNLNEPVATAGWGVWEDLPYSFTLRETDVAIVECRKVHPNNIIGSTMICAGKQIGNEYLDSCDGDSGGPLIAFRKSGSKQERIQVGIVSSGPKCVPLEPNEKRAPGVYTHVARHYDWVAQKIGKAPDGPFHFCPKGCPKDCQ